MAALRDFYNIPNGGNEREKAVAVWNLDHGRLVMGPANACVYYDKSGRTMVLKQLFVHNEKLMVLLSEQFNRNAMRSTEAVYHIGEASEYSVDQTATNEIRAESITALRVIDQDETRTIPVLTGGGGAENQEGIPDSTFVVVLPVDLPTDEALKGYASLKTPSGNVALVDDRIFGVKRDYADGTLAVDVLFIGEFYVGDLNVTYQIPTYYGHVVIPVTKETMEVDPLKNIINTFMKGFEGLVMERNQELEVITNTRKFTIDATGVIKLEYTTLGPIAGDNVKEFRGVMTLGGADRPTFSKAEMGLLTNGDMRNILLLKDTQVLSSTVETSLRFISSRDTFDGLGAVFPPVIERIKRRLDTMKKIQTGYNEIFEEIKRKLPTRAFPKLTVVNPQPRRNPEPVVVEPEQVEEVGEEEPEPEEAVILRDKNYDRTVVKMYKGLRRSIKTYIKQLEKLEAEGKRDEATKTQIAFLKQMIREMYARLEELKAEPAIIVRRKNYGNQAESKDESTSTRNKRQQANLIWKDELDKYEFPSMEVASISEITTDPPGNKRLAETAGVFLRDELFNNKSLPIPLDVSILSWESKTPVLHFKYDYLYGSAGGRPGSTEMRGIMYRVINDDGVVKILPDSPVIQDKIGKPLSQDGRIPTRGILRVIFDENIAFFKYDLDNAKTKFGRVIAGWSPEKVGEITGTIFAPNKGDYVTSLERKNANRFSPIEYQGFGVVLNLSIPEDPSAPIEFNEMGLIIAFSDDVKLVPNV